MKITLIRHGKTPSNLRRSYTGSIDDPLSEIGREEIAKRVEEGYYPKADMVIVSCMTRCLQTANIIYPKREFLIVDQLKECDFGDFEGKTFEELKDNPNYQAWIAHDGDAKYSNGESTADFKKRVQQGFLDSLQKAKEYPIKTLSIVCHGGTIMGILDGFSSPHQDYFSWIVENGKGYQFDFLWEKKLAQNIIPL